MRKIIILLAMVSLLSLLALAAHDYKTPFDAPRRYGVERVTHYDPRVNFARVDTTVYLGPGVLTEYKGVGRGGYAPFYARGTARVRSSTWYGYPRAQVDLVTKDLPSSDDIHEQFEAWLVDQETGQRLSLGTFTTGFGGTGVLYYQIDNYFDAYDVLEVTKEPFDDNDVSPGPVALIGKVPPPNLPLYFNPPPKQAKMVTETFTVN